MFHLRSLPAIAVVAALLPWACARAPAQHANRPEPGHGYPVPADVGRLVSDDGAFAAFAGPLRRDLQREVDRGDLRGASLTDHLFVLALLDAIDDQWPDAIARIDRIASLTADPVDKAMRGLTIRVWADTYARGDASPAGFRAAMARALDRLPIDRVRDQLSMLRTMAQVFTPEVCRQLVEQQVAPHIEHGSATLEQAQAIAFQHYAVKRLVPVGPIIDAVLKSRGIAARTQ